MLLEEFDETISSTFDPYEVENVIEGFPKIGVSCFSKKLFDQLINKFRGIEIAFSSCGPLPERCCMAKTGLGHTCSSL